MSANTPAEDASAPNPTVQCGSWSFGVIPPGWQLIAGHGIRNANEGAFPSSVIVGQDTLQSQTALAEYVKAQLVVINTYLPEARHIQIQVQESGEADEAVCVEIELSAPDGGCAVMRQLYARFGAEVGVVTMTTIAGQLSQLEPIFESIRAGLTFQVAGLPAPVEEHVVGVR